MERNLTLDIVYSISIYSFQRTRLNHARKIRVKVLHVLFIFGNQRNQLKRKQKPMAGGNSQFEIA